MLQSTETGETGHLGLLVQKFVAMEMYGNTDTATTLFVLQMEIIATAQGSLQIKTSMETIMIRR